MDEIDPKRLFNLLLFSENEVNDAMLSMDKTRVLNAILKDKLEVLALVLKESPNYSSPPIQYHTLGNEVKSEILFPRIKHD